LPINATITASYNGEDPVVDFQWTFTLVNPLPQGAPAQEGGLVGQAPNGVVKTQSPQASLSAMPLILGSYSVSVTAIDANSNVSAPAQGYVTLVAADLASVRL